MKHIDNRRLSSPLNATKSTGPKTDAGKQKSAANARRHGAYSRKILLPGEDPAALQLLVDSHFHLYRPTNPIEENLVLQLAHTLWRVHRQAPAESSLVSIQMHRLSASLTIEFASVTPEDLYALATHSLNTQGQGASQICRQERRLLRQYQDLRDQLLATRDLTPPHQPDTNPPEFNQPAEETVFVETNLTSTVTPPSNFDPHAAIFALLPAIPPQRVPRIPPFPTSMPATAGAT